MQYIRYTFMDGTMKDVPVNENQERLIIKRNEVPPHVKYLDLMPDLFTADAGEEGFFLIPSIEGSHYASLTFFHERRDNEEIFPESSMPLYAWSCNGKGRLAIVEGMRFEYSLVTGVKNGHYYLYPRFLLEDEMPYEDIKVYFLDFTGKDASWQNMAKAYREYQLRMGNCRTLKEKAQERPILAEYAKTIECRIRLAWKEVPSKIDDQIIGVNEPEVHGELTFEDAGKIIAEFAKQGIDKVNFCLVGWNAGGHDGRFPDLFPVEKKCGSLEDLKKLIQYAREKNYMITAHTNLYEGYSIATRFNRDFVLRRKDGSEHRGGNWGGGKSYLLCPEMAYKNYIDEDMESLKELGFYGAHYLDVFSILPPYSCSHPDHKSTCREAAQWRCKILKKNTGGHRVRRLGRQLGLYAGLSGLCPLCSVSFPGDCHTPHV